MKLNRLLNEGWDTDELHNWVANTEHLYDMAQQADSPEEFKDLFYSMGHDREIPNVDFGEVDWSEIFWDNKEEDEEDIGDQGEDEDYRRTMQADYDENGIDK